MLLDGILWDIGYRCSQAMICFVSYNSSFRAQVFYAEVEIQEVNMEM